MLTITPSLLLAIAAGGALGALARYLTHHAFSVWFGTGFPLGTLVANVSGCFLIGLFMGYWTNTGIELTNEIRAFIVIGFLGAFTTFSAFSLDTIAMIQNADYFRAGLNISLNLVLCLIATLVGFWMIREFVSPT